MESMDKSGLKEFLMKNDIQESDASILFDQNVDGKSFLSVNNDDLKEIGIKLGDRKKLLCLIETENQKVCQAPPLTYSVVSEVSSPEIYNIYDGSTPQLQPLSTTPTTSAIYSPDAVPFSATLKYSKPENVPVLEAVRSSDGGKKILEKLKSDSKIISQKEVREIIRLVVSRAAKDLGTLYPTYQQKLNIAKGIVIQLPQLKGTREDCEGYEQYFDPISRAGMIEWRFKTMRLSLTPSKKKYKQRKRTLKDVHDNTEEEEEEEYDQEEIERKITWLKYEVPTEIHRTEIFENMAVTFKHRRKFISKMAPSITEVLNLYPKFMEFDGDLIDAEFSQMFPNCGTLLGKFPSLYTPRILKYCKEKRLDIYERYVDVSDENLSACLMLSDMLPVTGLRKKLFTEVAGKKMPADCIVRFYGENSDLMAELNSTARSGIQQPYLMSQGSTEKRSYFLVLDKKILTVGSCGIKAIDKLYKAHFVFDVQYEKQCSLFFSFLENFIYKTYKGPVKGVVETLHMLIERVVIDS